MSSAPTTSLVKRSYARMQISIDDDGVHLTVYSLDKDGNPITNPITKRAGCQISLTMQEAVDIGDHWSGLRFETPALFNGNPVPPRVGQIITCSICFGSGVLNAFGHQTVCNYCNGDGYVSRKRT